MRLDTDTLLPKLAIAIFAQIALTLILAMTGSPKIAVTIAWLYVVFCACLRILARAGYEA